MKTQNIILPPALTKMLVLVLCFVMVFCLASRPLILQASANTASGLIEIGASYGDIATVAPYLIPIILMLIGIGWYYSNIDEIVAKAEEIYNTCDTSVKNWIEDVKEETIYGDTVVFVPPYVRTEIVKQAAKEWNDKTPYLLPQRSLYSLDTLSAEDVLVGQDAAITDNLDSINQGVESIDKNITAGNSISSQILDKLMSLTSVVRGLFENLIADMTSCFTSITTELGDLISQELGKLEDIFTSVASIQYDFFGLLDNIGAGISGFRNRTEELFYAVINSTNSFLHDIRGAIVALPSQIGAEIQSIYDSIPGIDGAGGSSGSNEDDKNKVDGIVFGGINSGLGYYGSASSILEKYSAGFLAAGLIFRNFADVPFIADLLIVSLSVGLVAVFLGIALNISSSGAKASKSNLAKGGGA